MSGAVALATISLDRMAGGLERNIVYLANHLAKTGTKVVLLTFDRPRAQAYFEIDPRVTWYRVGASQPHAGISFRERLRLIGRIRAALRRHGVDRLVCFHHGILFRFLAATMLTGIRVVCSERNSLTIYRHIRRPKWNLNFLLLFLVDAITVQFPSYVSLYPRLLRRRIHVVHNPVFPRVTARMTRAANILSIGRFAAQKRFELLVEAFDDATRDHTEWTLTIVGDGPLKPDIEALVASCGLTGRVALTPPTRNLEPFFSQARLYCQPSQWEGFPNAQAEAMAAGVIPVGPFDTSGVADLIEDGVNGILAQSPTTVETLAAALRRAIETPHRWEDMAEAARGISRRYSVESWQAGWDGLLASLQRPPGSQR